MVAFVYGLNDTDETVRAEAADEIGDQLRSNPCCCSKELTAALTLALADCDRTVRHLAERALKACGYEVVDGCCDKSGKNCKTSCSKSSCTNHGKVSPTPNPRKKSDQAPPAPGKGDIYFNTPIPSRKSFSPEWESTSSQRTERSRRLSNLFGLLK